MGFEGGDAAEVAAKPYMPNLELEAAAIMATKKEDAHLTLEKDELLLELNSLTHMFEDIQSSMDYKAQLNSETIHILEDKNALLEDGLNVLTVDLEEQELQLKELRHENEQIAAKEKERVNENEMLRLRLRELELAQSDAAFLTRKVVTPTLSMTEPNKAAVAAENTTRLSPKAPSAPIPPHLYQQRQVEQLQLKAEKDKMEQSSVLKSFRLGVGKGMKNVGRALNLWTPFHNALLWGELRGN